MSDLHCRDCGNFAIGGTCRSCANEVAVKTLTIELDASNKLIGEIALIVGYPHCAFDGETPADMLRRVWPQLLTADAVCQELTVNAIDRGMRGIAAQGRYLFVKRKYQEWRKLAGRAV